MVFTVHLILTQYYMLYCGEWASVVTLIFREFAITELLKVDVNRNFFMMEMYITVSCAIVLW